MDILTYISKTVTNKYRDPASRTSTFTMGGYFIYLPISEDSNKFQKLKQGVFDNCFMNQGQKSYNFSLFSKMQSVYWGLKKFVRLWLWKRAKPASVDIDLYMNSLKSFPDSQKTKILHHGMIYEFRLTDISNIWKKSLTQSITFSPQPTMPRNPYLNIPFDKGHLFHFYMCMKDNAKFSIPIVIQKFINAKMSIRLFRLQAYTDLIDEAIANHIESSSDDTLFLDCVNMLAYHKRKIRNRKLSMDLSDIKKKQVVQGLKPMLKLHLLGTLSCNPAIKYLNKELVIEKLRDFFKKNPIFGRRIVSVSRRTVELAPPLFTFGSAQSIVDENEVLNDSEIDDEDYDFEQEAHQDPASAIAVGIHPSDQVVHEEILTDSDEEF
jgi:hypothetical protein